MIKINLLPEPDDSYALRRATFAGGGASAVGILLLIVFQYILLSSEINSQNESIAQMQQQLAAVKEKTREVSDLDERRQALQLTAQSITRVKLQQIGPVRLLEDLNAAVPERVWLTNLEENGSQYTLKGIGLNDFAVAAFETALQQKSYVKTADLKETSTAYLTKVISYNTADSSYTFFVVAADKVQEIGRLMKEEAKERGLQVYTRQPSTTAQKVLNTSVKGNAINSAQMGDSDANSAQDKRLVGWGRFVKVPDGIYYWNLSEGTEAKQFTINFTYDFSGMKPSQVAASTPVDNSKEAKTDATTTTSGEKS